MKHIKYGLQKYALIAFVVLSCFIVYKFDIIPIILEASPIEFSIIVLITFFISLLLTIQLNIMLRIFNKKLSFWDGWRVTSLNSYFNCVFPAKAGTVFKGLILKKKFGLNYSNYFSLTLVGNLVVFFINIMFFLFLSRVFFIFQNTIVFIIIAGMIISIICFFLFSSKLGALLPKMMNEKYYTPLIEGIDRFFKEPKALLNITLINVIILMLTALRLYLCFRFIGQNTSYLISFYIQVLTSISFIFSLTPSNLFIQEGTIIGIGNIFSIDLKTALAAAILDRSGSLIAIIISAALSTSFFKKNFQAKDGKAPYP